MFELPNIVFNPMFTWFGCARQNVALVMEWFRDFCPFATYIGPQGTIGSVVPHFSTSLAIGGVISITVLNSSQSEILT